MGKKLLFIFSFWFLYIPLEAQSFDFDDYVISNWGLEEGLPQSSVNDIIQSKNGYIWLATFGGLVRFDGLNFTTFDRSNSKGMRSDRILHLHESTDGSIWLSTEDGFIRYLDNNFRSYVLKQDDDQIQSPLTIDEDGTGTLWLSTNSNIFKFESDSFRVVEVSTNKINAEKALYNNDGAILTYDRQVYKTLGDSIYKVIDLQDLISNNTVEVIEYPKGSGTVFIATNGDGVQKYENGIITSHTIPEFSPYEEIWSFYIDKTERLWIHGFGGQGVWTGSEIESIDILNEIERLEFNTIFQDNEGNFWVASAGDGLFKLRPSRVKNIDEDEGLTNVQMLSLLEMENGDYLFSTNCGGVFKWDGTKTTVPPISDYLPNKCNWSMFEDSQNRFWFGSRILYRTNSINEPGIVIDSSHGFSGIDIFTIMEDTKSNIWIGALNGLYQFDGDSYKRFSTNDGLSYNDVRTLFEDSRGTLWIGTTAGLNKYENGVIQAVHLLDEGEEVQQPYIRAVHEDDSGSMWFGSYGNGLFRIKDGRVDNITVEDGLFDNVISHIIECDRGYFWMGSNRGISTVNKDKLNSLIEGSIPSVHAYSYGLSDGMNTVETNGGFQPNIIKNEKGDIYFPTVEGVAVISTKGASPNELVPPVFIEQIRTSVSTFESTSKVTLPYNDAFLEVRYTALNFSKPEQVQFRYRLGGLNNNWIDVEDQRRILFTRIPPGEYTLEISASNGNQLWSSEDASLLIKVIPPFWQTIWFYALTGLFFLTIGPSIVLIRIKQLRKQNELQRKFTEQLIGSQENERRRIASELHDSLGQQILVIKNRAELAKSFLNQPEELKEELDEIIGSAVNSITDVRSISHGLRPVHLEKFGLTESLKHMLEQVEQSARFELSYYLDDIDGAIPGESEINFYRVIQEGLNNIIKHSEASEASVTIKKTDNEMETKIWDDGKGFDQTEVKSISGLGLLGIKERVDTLSGMMSIKSTIEQGTTIQINIPIE